MLTATELKALLRAHGLRLNKRLGQHYLIDPSLAARLIEACRLSPDDHVIEIGAGLGALTEHLAPIVKRVIAVEVDRAICELLKRRLAAHRLSQAPPASRPGRESGEPESPRHFPATRISPLLPGR